MRSVKRIILVCLYCLYVMSGMLAGNKNGFIVRNGLAVLYQFEQYTERIRLQRTIELTSVPLNTYMERARLEAIQRLWGTGAVASEHDFTTVITETDCEETKEQR